MENILVDGDGLSLYASLKDERNKSNCTGGCAQTWPPLLSSFVLAGEGVQIGLFRPVTRDDGSSHVTYDGHPLYNFSGDSQAGEAKGQGVGGSWFVVSPDGEPVTGR